MRRLGLSLFLLALLATSAAAEDVRVKNLGRFQSSRESALVGYGIVTGLAGSGDSPHSEVTAQALQNVLGRFGANVTPDQIRSRNVAAVMVMATFPPSAKPGDRIDVTVSSIGDARSLMGGALLLTPLMGPDQRPYALAQGSLVVGGYRFDADLNVQQKNHPTSAVVPGGATIEQVAEPGAATVGGELAFVLNEPNLTTAERLADGINTALGSRSARVQDAKSVAIRPAAGADLNRLMARIENVAIDPDLPARVVVNERSGTVVAGSGVKISSVVISQGDIRVSVTAENQVSQPTVFGGFVPGARSLVVTNTRLEVTEGRWDATVRFPNTTVADLVEGLSRAKVTTREMIAVLQAIKAAGALHAQIIVQ